MLPNTISLVGSTGAVGTEILSILAQRGHNLSTVRLFASERSAGKKVTEFGNSWVIENSLPELVAESRLVLMSAGASTSKALVPELIGKGCVVIDNSSAYRQSELSKLVVPEINGDLISTEQRLYSVPNCTAILLCMVLKPIHSIWPISRIIVSTYQSASGGGAKLMDELVEQTKLAVNGEEVTAGIPGEPYAFNLFSHNTVIEESGANGEEAKVIAETRSLLRAPNLGINVTCVRVPVLRAHTETVTIEFADKVPSVEEMREVLSKAPGVRLEDDRANNKFPTPLKASGGDDTWVGRLREDPSNPKARCLILSGDQLRKGAALTAVQIAEAYFQLN